MTDRPSEPPDGRPPDDRPSQDGPPADPPGNPPPVQWQQPGQYHAYPAPYDRPQPAPGQNPYGGDTVSYYQPIDSGGMSSGMAVQAPTAFFQSIGTQFEVRIEREGTRLRVREGHVALQSGNPPVVTGAGEELIVRADGRIAQGQAAIYGPEWDWVLQTAPRLGIEGLKVRAFLDWLAREEGWRVEFADNEAAVRAIAEAGGQAHAVLAELTRTEECRAAVEFAVARCGRIDGLVNNAGVNDRVGLEDGDTDSLLLSLRRNLVHYYDVARLALFFLSDASLPMTAALVDQDQEYFPGLRE